MMLIGANLSLQWLVLVWICNEFCQLGFGRLLCDNEPFQMKDSDVTVPRLALCT